jgi:type I restriction enzyme M protein
MSDQDDIIEAPQDAAEESGPDNFFIDILTGNKESASARKLPAQNTRIPSSSWPC